VITLFAPAGIGEVAAGDALAEMIITAVAADPAGPLRHGDIVVVTSKIISKAEGRSRPASERTAAITDETAATVAHRGDTVIVRTHAGLTLAAAGVDNSNVAVGSILLLPVDPDASAERLRTELAAATGLALGVVISDTAGRPWRLGQTDHAIGVAGVEVLASYVGRRDRFGNELRVTETAVADEVAAAADLVKAKLADRPVAVVRGLADQMAADGLGGRAADLIRPQTEDMFSHGSREAVVAAVLAAVGTPERYEEAVTLRGAPLAALVTAGRSREEVDLLRRVLQAAELLGR
jgi:coenzyme F420-0:L-glutamate ligase/coenzyme F420-1:gamma-L-glutamate ligase